MATQNPTSWEKLLQFVQYDARTDESSRKILEKLHQYAQTDNDSQYFTHVREILGYAQEKFPNLQKFNPNDVLKESETWRNDLYPLEKPHQQENTQSNQQPSLSLADFFPQQKAHTGGGGKSGITKGSQKIISIQQQRLEEALRHAQQELLTATTDEQRQAIISRFVDEHLDIVLLTQEEHALIRDHLPEDVDAKRRSSIEDYLSEREKTVEAEWTSEKNQQQRGARRQRLITQVTQLFDPTNKDNNRFARFARGQLSGLRESYGDVFSSYSLFPERVYRLFLSSFPDEEETTAPEVTEISQISLAPSEEEPVAVPTGFPSSHATPPLTGGIPSFFSPRSGMRAASRAKKAVALAENAKKVATGLRVLPFLFSWWFWAIVGIILLLCLVFFLLFNLLGFGNTSSSTIPGLPQDMGILVEVVNEVKTCEGSSYHPPQPACVILAVLHNTGAIVTSGSGVDLLGFATDMNRSYPHFQCGQFIWAAQTYLLKWPVFPGNVPTVYAWYTLSPSHTLSGYSWIPNPDSPALLGSTRAIRGSQAGGLGQSPANILPGDIILYGSTGGNDPGHIAFVIGVQKDNFNISVVEANYYSGAVDTRNTNLNDGLGRGAYILGWWRLIKNQTQ